MNKRTALLALAFIVLGLIAWFASTRNDSNKTNFEVSETNFAVEDFSVVHEVRLEDQNARKIVLKRSGKRWKVNGEYLVRQSAVDEMLRTFKKVKVRYVVNKAAKANVLKMFENGGVTVTMLDRNGKKVRKYVVGDSTLDGEGSYMMMDGSKTPYATEVKGLYGIIRPRLYMRTTDWRDWTVFEHEAHNVKRISVNYPTQRKNSFILETDGISKYSVKPYYPLTHKIDKPVNQSVALSYINLYKKLGAEGIDIDNPFRDSLQMTIPFASIEVLTKKDEVQKVNFYPLIPESFKNKEGVLLTPPIERYFVIMNDTSDIYTVQQRVVGQVLWGYDYFYETQKK